MEKTAKKPLGFYVLAVQFVLERFSFYSAKWLIAVFLVAKIADGGLALTPGDAAKITANLVAFTYAAPIIGGYLSDKVIGARYLVPLGSLFMGAGYLVGSQATTPSMVNIMIGLVAIGTGLFKSQANAITGRLFDDPAELDGAFSTMYAFVNAGAFMGTTIIGILAATKGYSFCFLVVAIIMFVNAICFVGGWKFLGDIGKRPFKIDVNIKETAKVVDNTPLTVLEKKRIAAIILVSAFSIVFWILWYLAYMPVYYHWGGDNGAANWMLGSFEIPTSWFDSLNAFACITFGPLFGMIWSKLAARPQGDMSMFRKTALAIILLGSSYLIFVAAEITRGTGQASILWIVLFGVVLTAGEMTFSPLGNSFIAKYAPAKLLTCMMSVWVVAVFFAGKGYGYLYDFTLKFDFAMSYTVIAAVVITMGAILWMFDGKLKTLVEDEAETAEAEVKTV